MLKCHVCGHEQVLQENVHGGLRIELYTTDVHKLVLACEECKSKLEMYFVETPELNIEEENESLTTNNTSDAEPVLEEDKNEE